MQVAKAHAVVRFQIDQKDGEPEDASRTVYLLRVPSIADESELNRYVASLGGVPTTEGQVRAALVAFLEEAFPEGDPTRATTIEAIHALEADREAPDDAKLPEEQRAAYQALVAAAVDVARRQPGDFATRLADRANFIELRILGFLKLFLAGWERGPVPFRRAYNRAADECIRAMAPYERTVVANRIFDLSRATEAQKKT